MLAQNALESPDILCYAIAFSFFEMVTPHYKPECFDLPQNGWFLL
jgi:hypothetical protein